MRMGEREDGSTGGQSARKTFFQRSAELSGNVHCHFLRRGRETVLMGTFEAVPSHLTEALRAKPWILGWTGRPSFLLSCRSPACFLRHAGKLPVLHPGVEELAQELLPKRRAAALCDLLLTADGGAVLHRAGVGLALSGEPGASCNLWHTHLLVMLGSFHSLPHELCGRGEGPSIRNSPRASLPAQWAVTTLLEKHGLLSSDLNQGPVSAEMWFSQRGTS